MYAFVMAVLRAAGDSKTPFYFMMLSVGLDISLNPGVDFGLGPVPRLGIAGSALATFIAQTVSLTGHGAPSRPAPTYPLPSWRGPELCASTGALAGALLRKGLPMGGRISATSVSGLLIISPRQRLRGRYAAAEGVALQIWIYIEMPAFAVGQAVSAMAAQNVGAGKWDRDNMIASIGVIYGIAITGSVIIVLEPRGARSFSPFLLAGSLGLAIAAHLDDIATPSYMFVAIAMIRS